ncbi:MAG TPA: class I SAM-dependent methyltransferase [Solirubrobacterales bacterium]|nr:class I SAM-dependent methyltransferase [Solirubrobacterales bacterium]
MPDPLPPLTPLAAAVLHVGAPERILALECGDGEAALFLAREFPLARVRGVDRSESAIRQATGRVGLDPEGRVAFKQGKPRSLPFPDDHFDLVTALDATPAPAEIERVLRPGGFLALARSRGDEALRGPAGALLRRRLAHRGIEPIWSEAAGEGSFSVFRLGRMGPLPASQ